METVKSLDDLKPGDIMFGPIGGAAGVGVRIGQLLVDGGFRVGSLDVAHVAIVVSNLQINGAPWVVEAMPSGARRAYLTRDQHWSGKYAFVRLPEDYPGQAEDAATCAQAMIGTPYSFLSYAALAMWRWGISTPKLEAWIGRRNKRSLTCTHIQMSSENLPASWGYTITGFPCEAICSVLVDQAWSLTGKKIFKDGRPHQCVTPSQLATKLLTDTPDTHWIFPRGVAS